MKMSTSTYIESFYHDGQYYGQSKTSTYSWSRFMYCKLPTIGKQLPAFLHGFLGSEHQTSEVGGPLKRDVKMTFRLTGGGGWQGGRVVTLSPPTSEAGVRFPARPQVRKLVVVGHWSAVYSTEP